MKLLERLTRYSFFTGKGGVGKTSLACASALALAERGERVLLVSTDPASNLGDVLGVRASGVPAAVPGASGLSVVDVDPIAAAARYRAQVVEPYRGRLPDSALRRMAEELSGACTVEIAAFDEFTRLLTDPDVTDSFDRIVFDTAPTGHTLRLFRLPTAWSGFIETNTTGVSCLGPLAGLQQRRTRYAEAVALLADASRTAIVLVARPEIAALREAERTRGELADLGAKNLLLAVNGRFHAAGTDELALALECRGDLALAAMPPELAALPRFDIPLLRVNTVGLDALRQLQRGEAATTDARSTEAAGADVLLSRPTTEVRAFAPIDALVDDLERDGRGLVMVMGKGGVGKTSVAVGLARALAARGHSVHLTTTDPAAHVAEALGAHGDSITVGRIDPAIETESYRARVLEEAGAPLDDRARAMLREDLRSPCTEEVAVFAAFSRVVADAAQSFVILDTAPTGHTLLLMDATGSYHREATRQARRQGEGNARTTLDRLRDATATKVIIVALPEPTPVLEATRLHEDLVRADIRPCAWVFNQLLDPALTCDPLLRHHAHQQAGIAEAWARERGMRPFVVPFRIDASGLDSSRSAALERSVP